MLQRDPDWLRHDQARWLRPDAHRWLRPDAERWRRPVHPDEAKYNPNQPRVPAGNPDGGQWTDADGGFYRRTDRAVRPRGIDDPRVLSDADPEPLIPGAQYAAGRRFGPSSSGTTGQQAREAATRAEADRLAALVRQLEPNWKPREAELRAPGSVEGQIASNVARAREAQTKLDEYVARGILVHPDAPSIPATSTRASRSEQQQVQVLGNRYGCSSCETREPGSATSRWIVNHDPPTSLNPSGASQRLTAHCQGCSTRQGGLITHLKYANSLAVRKITRNEKGD